MTCYSCRHYRYAEGEADFCAASSRDFWPPSCFPWCGSDQCPLFEYEPGTDEDEDLTDD
jgi:hypothetical protein